MTMEELTRQVLRRCFVELEASGRHVHLTKSDAIALFGHRLTPKRPLSQPGQYVANERVTIVGPKGELTNVAVLGPERPQSQVEVSLTDCVTLGLKAPVRLSGDTADTPGIRLKSGQAEITLKEGVLVARRHIHMTKEDAAMQGVKDGQVVHLRCLTARPLIFGDVVVRVSDQFRTYAHLDYDEANACGFQKGDLGMILRDG